MNFPMKFVLQGKGMRVEFQDMEFGLIYESQYAVPNKVIGEKAKKLYFDLCEQYATHYINNGSTWKPVKIKQIGKGIIKTHNK